MKKKITAVLCALAMALVLAACSGCGGEETGTTGAQTVTEAATTAEQKTTEKQTTTQAQTTTTQAAQPTQQTTAYVPVPTTTQSPYEPTTEAGGGEEPQTKQQQTTAPAEPETHECEASPTGFHSWKAVCDWIANDYSTVYTCRGCGGQFSTEEAADTHCLTCGGGSTWSKSRILVGTHVINRGMEPEGGYYDSYNYLYDECEYCGQKK